MADEHSENRYGDPEGQCARKACRRPFTGTRPPHKHKHTDRLYCRGCALRINRACAEVLVLPLPKVSAEA